MTLLEHIAACMAESNLRIGASGPAHVVLGKAMASDPSLAPEARSIIQSSASLERRDHITRWRNTMLRQALAEAGNVSPDVQ